jgi:quercetin dioxygenase-like cupin family protein
MKKMIDRKGLTKFERVISLFAKSMGGNMFQYADMSAQGIRLVKAAELVESDWSLPKADQIGFMRTVCRGVRGAGASLGIGYMPVGQRSPLHTPTAEHLILGLEGELTWRIEGVDYVTGEMDLLFIGANREYEYWNSSFKLATFVDVIGRVDEWPPSGNYKS